MSVSAKWRLSSESSECQGHRGMTITCCPGSSKSFWWGFTPDITDWTVICTANWSWHPYQPALWSRRPSHRACSTKMPPSQSYKRRCVACQHFPEDQTLQLQAEAGENNVIHLPSGLDHIACEQEEEEEEDPFHFHPFFPKISHKMFTSKSLMVFWPQIQLSPLPCRQWFNLPFFAHCPLSITV